MVDIRADNSIPLRQLQQHIITDNIAFSNVHSVSLSALSCLLKRHHLRMKQLNRVPSEHNSDRVQQLHYEYVQVSYAVLSLVLCSRILFNTVLYDNMSIHTVIQYCNVLSCLLPEWWGYCRCCCSGPRVPLHWTRAVQVCCGLGKCKFPQGCSGTQLVHWPPAIFCTSPATMLSSPQSNWRVLFSMALQGLWSGTPPTHTPFPVKGGGPWSHCRCSMPGLEMSLQRVPPLLSGQREHCLLCRWGAVARPRAETGCTLIFPLVYSNNPIFVIFYYSIYCMCCLLLVMPKNKTFPLYLFFIVYMYWICIHSLYICENKCMYEYYDQLLQKSVVPCSLKLQKTQVSRVSHLSNQCIVGM